MSEQAAIQFNSSSLHTSSSSSEATNTPVSNTRSEKVIPPPRSHLRPAALPKRSSSISQERHQEQKEQIRQEQEVQQDFSEQEDESDLEDEDEQGQRHGDDASLALDILNKEVHSLHSGQRSASVPTAFFSTGRRLSRKLPPHLTESLEVLASTAFRPSLTNKQPSLSTSPLGNAFNPPRKFSRKLPPHLTESLEILSTFLTPSAQRQGRNSSDSLDQRRGSSDSGHSMSSSTSDSASVATPSSISGSSDRRFTLEVAQPSSSSGSQTVLTMPSTLFVTSQRKGSTHSIPRKPIKTSMIAAPVRIVDSASEMGSPERNESVDLPPLLPSKNSSPNAEIKLFNRFSMAGSNIVPPRSDSLATLSPKTSVASMRTGPRHSLFPGSPFSGTSSAGPVTPTSSTSSRSPPGRSGKAATAASPRIQALAKSASHASLARSDATPALTCSSNSADSTCGPWSSFDIEYHPNGQRKETRKEKKDRKKAEKERFDESTPPSMKELFEASLMDVINEHGEKVRFGDLVRGKRTIVIFIRHWFCSLCAQYIKSIIQEVRPEALEEAGVELIIIGNGSSKMIDGYANKYFKSPFKTYTDPTLSLYRALGLTRQTGAAGAEEDKGDYLTESAMDMTINTLKRAAKMPLRNPGNFLQLGGEFVFDGTLNVTYTHRMINTRSHAPIRDVCAEAGVRLEFIHYEPGPPPPPVHQRSRINLLDSVPEDSALKQTSGDLSEGEEEAVVVIDEHRRGSEATQISQPELEESRLFHSAPSPVAGQEEDDADGLDDWQAEREKMLERIQALRLARRGYGSGKSSPSPGQVRGGSTREVAVVGQDVEVDEMGAVNQRFAY